MTRIIGGGAASTTLTVPKSGTRPTSDRVREAMFSSLEARDLIDGAHVADLYAGTGAFGLEAASRGAASVVLVDRAAQAAAACRRNARAVTQRVPGVHIDVQSRSAASFLRQTTAAFDVVFIDPPYEVEEGEINTLLDALAIHLTSDAIVMVERSRRSPAPVWPAGLEQSANRVYGDTVIWEATAVGEQAGRTESSAQSVPPSQSA